VLLWWPPAKAWLHEQTPPAGLDYRLGSRRAGPFELRALGGVKWRGGPKLGAKAGGAGGQHFHINLLVCHDPEGICDLRFRIYDLAGRLGAAPSRLSFGDPVAQAGARPMKRLVRLEKVASCSMVAVRKHLLNHNRESKRAGSFVLPAHAISIKNKHPLVIYAIPTRGFTAVVSVFMGTPPAKPLICKLVLNHLGALISDPWADPIGEKFLHPLRHF
jgi:hypothetical protein